MFADRFLRPSIYLAFLLLLCTSLLMSQSLTAGAAMTPLTAGAAMAPHMTRTVLSGPYKIVLSIGPAEKMYSLADYKKMHPKVGEIMLSGTMMMNGMESMGANSMFAPHHLEVHIYSATSGTVVRHANVAISITDLHTKKVTKIPVATMQGIGAGAKDYHYGNNVALMTEHYAVGISVNGRHVTFTIFWQEPQPSMSM